MNGAHLLFITFAVAGACWYLTRDEQPIRRRGPATSDVSPAELLAVLPMAVLAAVIASVLVAGYLLFGPR